MRLQLCMLCSSKPQDDFHMSRFPQLSLEPVLDQLEVGGEIVLARSPWVVRSAVPRPPLIHLPVQRLGREGTDAVAILPGEWRKDIHHIQGGVWVARVDAYSNQDFGLVIARRHGEIVHEKPPHAGLDQR